MGLRDILQKRRDDAELGQGIWRRANDRFNRGVDRFHQILERLEHDEAFELIVPEANTLADLLPRVRAVAVQAQRIAPSESNDIPFSPSGFYSDLNRCLSKAGNAVALCAEALAMTRCAGSCQLKCSRQLVVSRRVQMVVEHIEAAEAKLGEAQSQKAQSQKVQAQKAQLQGVSA